MKESTINALHIIITLIILLAYLFLCSITDYSDSSKLSNIHKNISMARIIFGFFASLLLLSLEFRYVTIIFKDNVLFRSLELIGSVSLICLYLYANEKKVIAGDNYDIITKILNPLIIALSIMSSGSINNLFNHYKDSVPLKTT
jgi:hypothetical protein